MSRVRIALLSITILALAAALLAPATSQSQTPQAAHQSAKGLVRERRGDRDAGHLHGGLSPEETATLAAPDARLGLYPGLRRPRAPGGLPHPLRGHGAVQGQGVAEG